MKPILLATLLGLGGVLFSGCQTPEKRAMSQMQRQWRAQMKMMGAMENRRTNSLSSPSLA